MHAANIVFKRGAMIEGPHVSTDRLGTANESLGDADRREIENWVASNLQNPNLMHDISDLEDQDYLEMVAMHKAWERFFLCGSYLRFVDLSWIA